MRWVQQYALTNGQISRRIVEKGLGIASARAAAVVRALEEQGWLLPARGPNPRQIAFSVDERRRRLSEMLGVAEDEVTLSGVPEEGTGEDGDVGSADRRICAAAQEAISAKDWVGLKLLAEEIDGLIDLALERRDAEGFQRLAATRRWVREWLGNR